MKKTLFWIIALILVLLLVTSCGTGSEDKSANISLVYAACTITSLCLLICCVCFLKGTERWLFLLFLSVLIVNIGYYCIAISENLEEALLANRIAYFGSVFLPFSMLMIILKVCNIKYRSWLAAVLLAVGFFVFSVAASPGFSDIYYKEVYYNVSGGVAYLEKVYGPWHILYLFFLLGYFAFMIFCIIFSHIKKKLRSRAHSTLLLFAVVVNIGVWLLEQFVDFDFELLSVSYIISEIFLLGLYFMLGEKEKDLFITRKEQDKAAKENQEETEDHSSAYTYLINNLSLLTPQERVIYDMYVSGKRTKDVMQELNIKENTLKYHNRNIYGKLGVSSRKELLKTALETTEKN